MGAVAENTHADEMRWDEREKQMSIKRNYFAETFSKPLNEIFPVILSGGNSHPES